MKQFLKRHLIILVFIIPFTQTAFQINNLVIIEDELVFNFPEKITFKLSIESDANIEKVTLLYSTETRSCQNKIARKDIDFEPGSELSLEWDWDFNRDSTLPPGTKVEWQWEITDVNGNTTLTDLQEAVNQDQRYDWQQISDQGITLQWIFGDRSFGTELHQISLESIDHIREILGIQYQEDIWITVYPTPEQVQEAVKFTAEWVGGVAFPDHNAMIIAGAPGSEDWLQSVIPHEMTHLIIDSYTFNCKGAWQPRWFSEGLADYSEDNLRPEERDLIRSAYLNDSIPELGSLVTTFSQNSEEANLAYLVSNAAVEYLIIEFGSDRMAELLDVMSAGVMIDPALEQVYGFDTDSLDSAWRRSFGFEVEDNTEIADSPSATDTPQPTLALWTSVVQVTATATITPVEISQITSTATENVPAVITPTTAPFEPETTESEDPGFDPLLIIAVVILSSFIIVGIIVTLRRRVA